MSTADLVFALLPIVVTILLCVFDPAHLADRD